MFEKKRWRKIAVLIATLISLTSIAADCNSTPPGIACNCDNEVKVTGASSGAANATQTCITQENGMRACATSKFQYALTPDGTWTWAVTDGTVYVTSAGRTVPVQTGMQTQFHGGQSPNVPIPIAVPLQPIPIQPQTFRIDEGAVTIVSSESVSSARLLTVLAPSVASIQGPAGAEFKVAVAQSGNTTISSVNKTITVNLVGQSPILVAPNQILPIEIRRSSTPNFQPFVPTPTFFLPTVVIRISPQPNPTQAPAPTSPSSATQCGGVITGGYCWYLGAENASCNAVCEAHGGYSEGTRLFAGSSGNIDNCKSVLTALKIPLSQLTSTTQGGLGCFTIAASGSYLGYWDQQPTTSSATYPVSGRRRVCACQR